MSPETLQSWIWFPVLVALALIGVLAMGSTAAIRSRHTNTAAVWLGLTHGVLPFVLHASLYFIIPRYKRILEDFNVAVPDATKLVIRASDLLVNYWYLLTPQLLFL